MSLRLSPISISGLMSQDSNAARLRRSATLANVTDIIRPS